MARRLKLIGYDAVYGPRRVERVAVQGKEHEAHLIKAALKCRSLKPRYMQTGGRQK